MRPTKHLNAYIYASVSLLALLLVIVTELRWKRATVEDCEIQLPPSAAAEANPKDQAARKRLQAACRAKAEFHLAHHSLGRPQLDRPE